MKNSIIFKINALFFIALTFLVIAFGSLFWIDKHQQEMKQGFLKTHHPIKHHQHIEKVTSHPYEFPWLLITAFVCVIFVGLILYRKLIKSLQPLKIITQYAALVGEGKPIDFSPYHFEDEEIITLANAIEKSSCQLQQLSETRKLMLRNIAHELKTPLTKGRFLVEMVNDEVLKERFETLFIRFEGIVNDILNIDALTSNAIIAERKELHIENVINDAIELLFLDKNNHVNYSMCHDTILANYPLFLLACKNMIDNGIKFSPDKSIFISSTPTSIIFENSGEPFERTFDELISPFTQEDASSQGLGLGLYIINRICEVHNFGFYYTYENHTHRFTIDYSKPI
jgi:two-component system OmpR family sensor kinase